MPETVTLPGLASMVPPARVVVRNILRGTPRVDDAELIVSELASNAVRHSRARDGGEFRVTVDVGPGRVRIEVADPGAGPPVEIPADERDQYGRGLEIVAAFADKWGHDRAADGASVYWAELMWEPTDG